jgi:signal transduction histidine kinase
MAATGTGRIDVQGWERSLLPAGVLGDGTGHARSLRDWTVDLVLFAFAGGFGLLFVAQTWIEHSTAMLVIDLGAGSVACLSLWWRRRSPLGVALLVIPISAFSALGGAAALVAAFTVAVRCPVRVTAGVAALAVAANGVVSGLYPPTGEGYDLEGLLIGCLLIAVAVGWGMLVGVQRRLLLSLREHARRVEAEQSLRLEQARRAERTRIAREMHDVLAHRVSLLSVHAGALEFNPEAPAEEVAEAAGVIRETAHAALVDLRDVLGVLREGEGAGRLEAPQPTLAELPVLVAESRAAGMDIRCAVPDAAGAVPAALGRTAYRIVQEGLTNARKHAPGSLVEVAVAGDASGGLDVVVRTRPRVGHAVGAAGPRPPGAGTGLAGLAERVSLAGGRLEHGPTAEGGFDLHARLPWAP